MLSFLTSQSGFSWWDSKICIFSPNMKLFISLITSLWIWSKMPSHGKCEVTYQNLRKRPEPRETNLKLEQVWKITKLSNWNYKLWCNNQSLLHTLAITIICTVLSLVLPMKPNLPYKYDLHFCKEAIKFYWLEVFLLLPDVCSTKLSYSDLHRLVLCKAKDIFGTMVRLFGMTIVCPHFRDDHQTELSLSLIHIWRCRRRG